jgi:sialate O-acetylesterase
MVHAFYLDDQWGVAKDPLIWFSTSKYRAHWNDKEENRPGAIEWERYFRQYGAGMGVRFGKEMLKHTGVPVGMIPCSHTATNMDQWSPDLKEKGGYSLYGAMIRRAKMVGKVAGILWYQGEADANKACSPTYKQKTLALIDSVRKDLNQPELPFLVAQLAVYLGDGPKYFPDWNIVQQCQLDLEKERKNVAVAPTADLTLSDWIHLDAIGQRNLGVRMSYLARAMKFHEKGLQTGPRPVKATLDSTRKLITIEFKGVNGSFQKTPKIMGFQVDCGTPQLIENVRAEGSKVVLEMVNPVGENAVLYHGHGHNPAVNLKDSAGLLIPIFGPFPIN